MQNNDQLHANKMPSNNGDMVNVFSEIEDVSLFTVATTRNELNNDWNGIGVCKN